MDVVTLGMARANAARSFVRGVEIVNPRGLDRARARFGGVLGESFVCTVIGDSIAQGVGSDNLPDLNGKTWYQYVNDAWPVQVARRLNARVGTKNALGFTGAISNWDVSTTSGSPTRVNGVGPMGGYTSFGSGGGRQLTADTTTVTFPGSKLGAFTALDVWYFGSAANVTSPNRPSVLIDGVEVQTSTSANASNFLNASTFTGLSDAAHDVVIRGTSGRNVWLAGITVRYANGVVVNRIAQAGAVVGNHVGQSGLTASGSTLSSDEQARIVASTTMPLTTAGGSDLVIISLGTNDQTSQVPLATYSAQLQTLITSAVSGKASVLLLGEPPAYTLGSPLTEQQYRDEMRNLALANTHCAFVDTRQLFGTNAQGLALGMFPASTVHPSYRGHGAIASLVAYLIEQPMVR